MITTPDNADAAATCPPFDPPGPVPNGFYKDCQTIPTAEDLNELILNLRALLAMAPLAKNWDDQTVPIVKGSEEMLWRGVLNLPIIDQQIVVAVETPANGGTPDPAHPETGDAFDSLDSALRWASRYRIAHGANLEIRIGPGTFQHTKPIEIAHPDGARLEIVGTGTTTPTVLNFPPSATPGNVIIRSHLKQFTGLKIWGSHARDVTGLDIIGGHVAIAADLDVRHWGDYTTAPASGAGISVQEGGSLIFGTIYVEDTATEGLVVHSGSTVTGFYLHGTQNGCGKGTETPPLLYPRNAPSWTAAVRCAYNSHCGINEVLADYCYQGILVQGNSHASFQKVTLGPFLQDQCALVEDGSTMTSFASPANAWAGYNPVNGLWHVFWARYGGLIRADACMNPNNKLNCSPANNTQGNVMGYVAAS